MLLSSKVNAKTLSIVAGLHKPPYVIKKGDDITGFEVELISHVMSMIGHQCHFELVSFARSMRMLEQPYIDAIMSAPTQVFTNTDQLTVPYVGYQNVAVSLAANPLEISKVADLSKYTMAGFQMASQVLGGEFKAATKQSPLYTELSNQTRQVEMLAQGKIDVLVMDINIFNYINRGIGIEVEVYEVFPISRYHLALRDMSLVPEFNKAFSQFRTTSQYKALLKKYNMLERI